MAYYHLLSLYESYSFSLVFLLSVWILGPLYLKNRINNHVAIFTVSMSSIGIALITSFYVITQPWRQLGAILCFHVIINIFITIHHKLTKFNTHKLQGHTLTYWTILGPVRVTARTCARVKILPCSKSPINNFEHEPGHLEHFQIFRPYVSARAFVRVHSARKGQNSKFFAWFGFLLTIIDNFHSFAVTLDLS